MALDKLGQNGVTSGSSGKDTSMWAVELAQLLRALLVPAEDPGSQPFVTPVPENSTSDLRH